jgi:hypothetical protein
MANKKVTGHMNELESVPGFGKKIPKYIILVGINSTWHEKKFS